MNPKCVQNKNDCFANKKGNCQILEKDTQFTYADGSIRPCPFYKNKKGDKK